MRLLQPPGWPAPVGYANGIAAAGETVFVGGQVGWDVQGAFAEGLAAQVGQALRNIVAVLAEAGAGPGDVVRMTWYLVDVDAYAAGLREIGREYRAVMGRHYPAMSAVGVARLVERRALVEIEATAVVGVAAPRSQ